MLLRQQKKMTKRQTRKQIKFTHIDEQTLNTLVSEINRLYITHRKTYLKQFIDKETGKGETRTITYDDTKPKNYMNLPLNDELIRRHLVGKQRQNFGVINSKVTKILTFDFDITDKTIRTFYYHKVQAALRELGIEENNYIVNRSGKKGIHLTVFFEKVLTHKAEKLYKNVIAMIRDDETDKKYLKKSLNEAIEMKGLRAGVKLPFSYHIETGNRARLLHRNRLKPINDLELCKCVPLPAAELDDIIEKAIDSLDYDEHYTEPINDKELFEQTNKLAQHVNELDIYKLGHDKEYTASYYNELLQFGLKSSGTRHNSCFMLAVHLKNEFGMTKNETITTLNDWIARQDKSLYSTELDICFKENRRICEYVYEKDIHINVQEKLIEVTKSELKTILTAKNKDNKPLTFKQKAIFFSLLLHSKRYASEKNSSFYMTYKQIKETANVSKPQLISDTITKLEEKNYIEIVRRNTQAEHQKEKLPNIYRMTLNKEKSAQCVGRTSNAKEKTLKFTECNSQTFKMVVNKLFTKTELQRFKLTTTNIKYFKS